MNKQLDDTELTRLNNLVITNFLQDQVVHPQQLITKIHPQDEMFLFALKNVQGRTQEALMRYFSNGKRIFDAVEQIVNWYFQGWQNIDKFLDFAAGYGRGTRFLRQALPPEKLWVSDIYAEGVAFQENLLGVRGIVSSDRPEQYVIDQKFDCIFACSFFSHLPEATFLPWLEKLYSLLTEKGILIFTVHDVGLMLGDQAKNSDKNSHKIYFQAESESQYLDPQQYGVSYVGENWVTETIKKVINPGEKYYRIPQGLCNHQDIYLIAKNPLSNIEKLKFYYHPDGNYQSLYWQNNQLFMNGFAKDLNIDGEITQLQILLNSVSLSGGKTTWAKKETNFYFANRLIPEYEWRYILDLNSQQIAFKPDDVLLVKLVNNFQMERVIQAITINNIMVRHV